jgi:transposase
LARGIRPGELWADRGYDSRQLREQLRLRAIKPMISERRRKGEQPACDQIIGKVYRGQRKRLKTRDPLGRQRWPVERTNAWLRNWRRVATRWERRPELWLAVIQVAAAIVIYRMLENSLR